MNHLYYLEDIVFVTFLTVGTKQKQVDGGRAVVEYQTGRQQYLESRSCNMQPIYDELIN